MQSRREEVIRIAKEMGMPIGEEATVTEIVHLLSVLPDITPDFTEALDTMLDTPSQVDMAQPA